MSSPAHCVSSVGFPAVLDRPASTRACCTPRQQRFEAHSPAAQCGLRDAADARWLAGSASTPSAGRRQLPMAAPHQRGLLSHRRAWARPTGADVRARTASRAELAAEGSSAGGGAVSEAGAKPREGPAASAEKEGSGAPPPPPRTPPFNPFSRKAQPAGSIAGGTPAPPASTQPARAPPPPPPRQGSGSSRPATIGSFSPKPASSSPFGAGSDGPAAEAAARGRARAASMRPASMRPEPSFSGKKVLDAFQAGSVGAPLRPQAPANIFQEKQRTKEEIEADRWRFELNQGQIFLTLSFFASSLLMFGTVYLVYKLGAIHFNDQ